MGESSLFVASSWRWVVVDLVVVVVVVVVTSETVSRNRHFALLTSF